VPGEVGKGQTTVMLIMGFVLELLPNTHAHNVTRHKKKLSKQMLTNIDSLKPRQNEVYFAHTLI